MPNIKEGYIPASCAAFSRDLDLVTVALAVQVFCFVTVLVLGICSSGVLLE